MSLHVDAMELAAALHQIEDAVEHVGAIIAGGITTGDRVFVAGNGGSAAQAQHFAAELTGRYLKERKPLPGICLNTDTAALTAIANDYGYEQVFARQVEALCVEGDYLLLFTTSGNSQNLIFAARAAREIGVTVVAITGRDGGALAGECHYELRVPMHDTPQIQAAHMMVAHEICRIVEDVCQN